MLLTDHLVEVRAILTHHNHSSVYAQYITFAMSWAVHWSIWIWTIMFCYIIPFRGVPLLQCHLNVYSCMSLLSFIHFFYITLFKAPSNDLKSLTVTSAANLGSIKHFKCLFQTLSLWSCAINCIDCLLHTTQNFWFKGNHFKPRRFCYITMYNMFSSCNSAITLSPP